MAAALLEADYGSHRRAGVKCGCRRCLFAHVGAPVGVGGVAVCVQNACGSCMRTIGRKGMCPAPQTAPACKAVEFAVVWKLQPSIRTARRVYFSP